MLMGQAEVQVALLKEIIVSLSGAHMLLTHQTRRVQELLDIQLTSIQTSEYVAIPTQVGVSSGVMSRKGMGVGS